MKSDLAAATMSAGPKSRNLSHDELKQLFSLDTDTTCSTRELLQDAGAVTSTDITWLDISQTEQLPAPLADTVAQGSVTDLNQEAASVESVDDSATTVGTSDNFDTDAAAETVKDAECSLYKGRMNAFSTVDDVSCLEVE